MKHCILRGLMVPLLGFALFSCPKTSGDTDTDVSTNSESKKNGGSQTTKDGVIVEKTIQQIFLDVVKVLHAPHNSGKKELFKGKKFFVIVKGKDAINETVQGSDSQVGEGKNGGSGTYTITAEGSGDIARGDKANCYGQRLSYTYSQYQPKGSDITVDGKIKIFSRANETHGNKAKSTEKCNAIDNFSAFTKIDTLTISGPYDAELKFMLDWSTGDSKITDENYEKKVIGDLHTSAHNGMRVEFNYKGQKLKLGGYLKPNPRRESYPKGYPGQNIELFKKLILVS